jgi:hypothetical protein
MAFQPLSTSNTFTQWITETQRSISVLNQITDGVNDPTNYSNTSISVGNDLTIGGNLTIGGLLILDDIGYNDLDVSGNLSVGESLTALSGDFQSLVVLNDFTDLNTASANVGTNASLNSLSVTDTITTGNITVTGDVTGTSNLTVNNLVISQNVQGIEESSEVFVGKDVNVSGDLLAFLCCQSTLSLNGDLTANLVVIDTATVNTLIGTANTNIYNSIFASNAYTSVQNTLAEFASLSCILG